MLSINRVFLHILHHPPCCLCNFTDWGRQFHEDERDIWSLLVYPFKVTSAGFWRNLPQWSISKSLMRWCLSVIMKFSYSFFCWFSFKGQVSRKFILPFKGFNSVFFSKCYFKRGHRKRRPFISECDVHQNDFRTLRWLSTVFVYQNFDMTLGFQSRDKSLNNYYAIEIKSRGFYASSVTIP